MATPILGNPHILSEKEAMSMNSLGNIDCSSYEEYFSWGYYSTHYKVGLYIPFGYSILYMEYHLTRFNHQKNATHMLVTHGWHS